MQPKQSVCLAPERVLHPPAGLSVNFSKKPNFSNKPYANLPPKEPCTNPAKEPYTNRDRFGTRPDDLRVSAERDMSHIFMSHVTLMYEACHN